MEVDASVTAEPAAAFLLPTRRLQRWWRWYRGRGKSRGRGDGLRDSGSGSIGDSDGSRSNDTIGGE